MARRRAVVVAVATVGLLAAVVACERRGGDGAAPAGTRSAAAAVVPVGLVDRAAPTTTVPGVVRYAPTGRITIPLPSGSAAPIRTYLLTGEAYDHYLLDTDGESSSVVAAATNVGGNTRLIWANLDAPVQVDGQVCADWDGFSGLAQPGLALRVRRDGTRTRAITVTDNIFWGARFGFNVHLWDTGSPIPGALPVQVVGGADLSATFGPAGALQPLPWRVCARVKGRIMDIKAWPLRIAEPLWGDVRYGRRFQLPVAAVYEGRAGWYAGHLRPGDELDLSAQQVRPLG